LKKYESWDEFRSNKFIKPIFKTEPEFRSAKGKGVGQKTITKFLDEELKKYDSWEEVRKYRDNFIGILFSNKKGDFLKAKKHGVGRETIAKFLGDG